MCNQYVAHTGTCTGTITTALLQNLYQLTCDMQIQVQRPLNLRIQVDLILPRPICNVTFVPSRL